MKGVGNGGVSVPDGCSGAAFDKLSALARAKTGYKDTKNLKTCRFLSRFFYRRRFIFPKIRCRLKPVFLPPVIRRERRLLGADAAQAVKDGGADVLDVNGNLVAVAVQEDDAGGHNYGYPLLEGYDGVDARDAQLVEGTVWVD